MFVKYLNFIKFATLIRLEDSFIIIESVTLILKHFFLEIPPTYIFLSTYFFHFEKASGREKVGYEKKVILSKRS